MAAGINITDRAAEKIKQLLAAEKREGQGLRFKVVGGGCSGPANKLVFDGAENKFFENDGAMAADRTSMVSWRHINGNHRSGKGATP